MNRTMTKKTALTTIREHLAATDPGQELLGEFAAWLSAAFDAAYATSPGWGEYPVPEKWFARRDPRSGNMGLMLLLTNGEWHTPAIARLAGFDREAGKISQECRAAVLGQLADKKTADCRCGSPADDVHHAGLSFARIVDRWRREHGPPVFEQVFSEGVGLWGFDQKTRTSFSAFHAAMVVTGETNLVPICRVCHAREHRANP